MKRRYGSDLFSKRIVITIPPIGLWGIILAIVTGLAVRITYLYVLDIVSVLAAFISITTVIVTRKQVREFRAEMSHAIRGISDDDDIPLKEIDTANGADYLRVPKR